MRNKIIFENPKKKSRVEMDQLDDDDWFYSVHKVEKSGKKKTKIGTIIKKDIPDWESSYLSKGYIKK